MLQAEPGTLQPMQLPVAHHPISIHGQREAEQISPRLRVPELIPLPQPITMVASPLHQASLPSLLNSESPLLRKPI